MTPHKKLIDSLCKAHPALDEPARIAVEVALITGRRCEAKSAFALAQVNRSNAEPAMLIRKGFFARIKERVRG